MNDKELLFYDVEVFENDSLAVFKDIEGTTVGKFWNNRSRKVIEDPSGFEGIGDLIEGKTLVGYNNYSYDDYILTVMLDPALSMQRSIYAHNNSIIRLGGVDRTIDRRIRSIDTMQQISVSHPSLKQIEGNMGKSIIETSVSFDIERPLTDEERKETEKYCEYDVLSTIEVYKLRKKSYFETKESLLEMLPETTGKEARWNTTTLSANILLGKERLKHWRNHRVPDQFWRNVQGIPSDVWDMWEDSLKDENITKKGRSTTFGAYGCNMVMGMGGLHGAPAKAGRYENIKLADVGSMYPSIICMLNALESATPVYDGIRQERLKIKHTDKVRANAMKLILNSVYGLFKSPYSGLFNPRASATVCIFGQIALFTLCRELYEAGYELVNVNTDGVAFVDNPAKGNKYRLICDEWEKKFSGLSLEVDTFDTWIQKDVNNYIATQGDHVKVKGGEVNKYHGNRFFDNNNCRILQIATVDKLVYGTDILETLANRLNDPLLWQYILKAGSTYLGVRNKEGEWQNKVNRVFATREELPHTKLYKIRDDGGEVSFPDAPEFMYLWNGDLSDLHDFSRIVNIDHYYSLIEKKLKGWPADVY